MNLSEQILGVGMRRRFQARVDQLNRPTGPVDTAPVSDDDIAALPSAAQRYLRFMGVVGQPPDWSFRARFVGEFRQRAEQKFMPCEAWKYNTNLVPARVVPAYDTGGAARELDSAKPGRMDAQQGLLHVCSQIGASVAAPVEAANDEPAQAPPRRNSGWRRYGTSV